MEGNDFVWAHKTLTLENGFAAMIAGPQVEGGIMRLACHVSGSLSLALLDPEDPKANY